MWTFCSSFEAVHPLPPLTNLRWGGIFTPWTKFDWGGDWWGGTKLSWGGFFDDASGSRGSPPSVITLHHAPHSLTWQKTRNNNPTNMNTVTMQCTGPAGQWGFVAAFRSFLDLAKTVLAWHDIQCNIYFSTISLELCAMARTYTGGRAGMILYYS